MIMPTRDNIIIINIQFVIAISWLTRNQQTLTYFVEIIRSTNIDIIIESSPMPQYPDERQRRWTERIKLVTCFKVHRLIVSRQRLASFYVFQNRKLPDKYCGVNISNLLPVLLRLPVRLQVLLIVDQVV